MRRKRESGDAALSPAGGQRAREGGAGAPGSLWHREAPFQHPQSCCPPEGAGEPKALVLPPASPSRHLLALPALARAIARLSHWASHPNSVPMQLGGSPAPRAVHEQPCSPSPAQWGRGRVPCAGQAAPHPAAPHTLCRKRTGTRQQTGQWLLLGTWVPATAGPGQLGDEQKLDSHSPATSTGAGPSTLFHLTPHPRERAEKWPESRAPRLEQSPHPALPAPRAPRLIIKI